MSAGTAVTPVGAPGTVRGVTALETPAGPVPRVVVTVAEKV